MSDELYVRCKSHRSREKVFRVLGKLTCYYSFQRDAGTGGCYKVSPSQYEQIKGITGVSKLRGPYDDILKCWG